MSGWMQSCLGGGAETRVAADYLGNLALLLGIVGGSQYVWRSQNGTIQRQFSATSLTLPV
jgi:hypothetical protein